MRWRATSTTSRSSSSPARSELSSASTCDRRCGYYRDVVILADLEVWHSRSIAPTRRVALGRRNLPTEPSPGFGGLLLGGIVAARIEELDPDFYGDLHRLINALEEGRRIPQPRL